MYGCFSLISFVLIFALFPNKMHLRTHLFPTKTQHVCVLRTALSLRTTPKQHQIKFGSIHILHQQSLFLVFAAYLQQGRLLVQPQPPGEQPGRVLLQPDWHSLQPGGLPPGVRGGSERTADLPLHTQEEHGAAGAPPSAQGQEKPAGESFRPTQRLRGPDRRGLGLPGRAGGRHRPGGGDRGGGRRRRAQRVPGAAAGSVQSRPLECALLQPREPPERRYRGLSSSPTVMDFHFNRWHFWSKKRKNVMLIVLEITRAASSVSSLDVGNLTVR